MLLDLSQAFWHSMSLILHFNNDWSSLLVHRLRLIQKIVMKINSLIIFVLITLSMVSCVIFRPKPDKLFQQANEIKPFDVIIVPGLPYNGKGWTIMLKDRVTWAAILMEKGIAKNVIFSGGAVYSPYYEGKVMALYAEALGIPKEKIFVDTLAQHSCENIYYSYFLAKKMGFTKIAFATNPGQSRQLMGFAKRRFKLPIAFIPIVRDSLYDFKYRCFQIDPEEANATKAKNFKSIIETQNKCQRIKGTLGWNIRFEEE